MTPENRSRRRGLGRASFFALKRPRPRSIRSGAAGELPIDSEQSLIHFHHRESKEAVPLMV